MAALISEHQGYIYDVCLFYTKDEDKANLVKSAVLEQIWNKREKFQETSGPNSFKNWVKSVCHNSFINFTRNRHEKRKMEDVYKTGIASNLDVAAQLESRDKLIKVLNFLRSHWDEKSMNIFNLLILYGYNYDDISKETGIPTGTIKSKIFRMRASVRHLK